MYMGLLDEIAEFMNTAAKGSDQIMEEVMRERTYGKSNNDNKNKQVKTIQTKTKYKKKIKKLKKKVKKLKKLKDEMSL